MSEATSGALPAEDLKTCTECGRRVGQLKRKMCDTCYHRAWRGGGTARRVPLDPEIAALLLPVPGTSPSFAERVFTYVDASGDCWEWTGTVTKGAGSTAGYGVIGRGARGSGNMQAHCAVWSLLVGPIPDGMQYDHLCRNHGCVNPAHGEIVTAEENKRRGFSPAVLYSKRETCEFGHSLDGLTGGRGGREIVRYCKTCARERANARYVPKGPSTACKNGHEWTPESTYINPKHGTRTCKICKIERQRAAREADRKRADQVTGMDEAA